MSLGEDVHVVLVEKKRTTYVSKANDRPTTRTANGRSQDFSHISSRLLVA